MFRPSLFNTSSQRDACTQTHGHKIQHCTLQSPESERTNMKTSSTPDDVLYVVLRLLGSFSYNVSLRHPLVLEIPDCT